MHITTRCWRATSISHFQLEGRLHCIFGSEDHVGVSSSSSAPARSLHDQSVAHHSDCSDGQDDNSDDDDDDGDETDIEEDDSDGLDDYVAVPGCPSISKVESLSPILHKH